MLREPDEPKACHDRGTEILEHVVQRENAKIFVAEAGDNLVGWLSACGGKLTADDTSSASGRFRPHGWAEW